MPFQTTALIIPPTPKDLCFTSSQGQGYVSHCACYQKRAKVIHDWLPRWCTQDDEILMVTVHGFRGPWSKEGIPVKQGGHELEHQLPSDKRPRGGTGVRPRQLTPFCPTHQTPATLAFLLQQSAPCSPTACSTQPQIP